MQDTEPSKALMRAGQPFRNQESPKSRIRHLDDEHTELLHGTALVNVDRRSQVQVKPGWQLGGYAGGAPFS